MITATGAGASFIAVPPKRLKPKTTRSSPRNTPVSRPSSQQPRIRSPSSPPPPHPQEATPPSAQGSASSFQSFLFSGSRNPVSSSSEPVAPPPHHHLPIYEESDRSRSFIDEDFFGLHPLSQTEDCEPPSPKSFYSAETTSTTSTTKAGGRSSEDSTVLPTQLSQAPPRKTARKLQRPRPSSPPSSQQNLSLGTPGSSPTGLGINTFANYTNSHLSGHSSSPSAQYGEHQTGLKDFENVRAFILFQKLLMLACLYSYLRGFGSSLVHYHQEADARFYLIFLCIVDVSKQFYTRRLHCRCRGIRRRKEYLHSKGL